MRGYDGDVYDLSCGGIVIATLTVTELDWPWIFCDFTPARGFDAFKEVFADFLAAAKQIGTEEQRWDQTRRRVLNLSLVLEPASAEIRVPYPKVLLYVDGSGARFRLSERPSVYGKPKQIPLWLLPMWRRWACFVWWGRIMFDRRLRDLRVGMAKLSEALIDERYR